MRGGGYLNSPKDEILSITNEDKLNQTSFVKVGELFDEDTLNFNEDNYKILLKYVTGNSSATLATATTLAETNNNQFASSGYIGTDASVFRAKTISAGTEGDTAYVEKAEGKDICVRLGGLDWQVMYLSKDKNNNTILTLWLDNNVQEAWTGRSSTEGMYYGFAGGGLYSDWANNWCGGSPTSTYPGNMYGASYVNAITLNNGGVYSTSAVNSSTAQQSKDSAFALFTMPEFGFTDYLVTPRDVSWQEEQSAKVILGADYRYNNEAWASNISDSEYACYDSEASIYYNYSNIEYNDAWAYNYLWLPSRTETGYSTSYVGLWNTSTSQRQNWDGSNFSPEDYVGSSSGPAYFFSYLRSSGVNNAVNVLYLHPSGSISNGHTANVTGAIRPALHLNLSQIDAHFSATDISSGEITVTPESDTYNGSAKNPTVSVTYNGITLVNGTDYIVRAYINGTQVDEIKTAGIYTLKAVGKLNYTGSLSTTFIVQGGALGNTIISPPNECVVFKRSSGAPNLYLNDTSDGSNYRLRKDIDYTITHTIDYVALTGSATVVGMGNYSGGIVIKTYTLVLLDPKAGMYMAIYN